ncbi:plasmid mobilization protein [Ruminococcus sp.]|uniref:plasmid mobilization protein n=2 Tax=Ruminococcus sp. TaxID=41978 RepID=UPI0039671002
MGAKCGYTRFTRLGRGHCPYDPELRKIKRRTREMKDEKKRTLYLKVRVSPEEMAAIKKKFENSGMSSLSTFVRAMIFEGYIAQVNENELKELTRIANNVANNINQIAHRANVTNKIYKEDIEEVKSLASQIIDPLLFLQTKVLQLKH